MFLDSIEERPSLLFGSPRGWLKRFLWHYFVQLFDEDPLVWRHFRWNLDLNRDVQVTASTTGDVWQSFATQAEPRISLGAVWNGQLLVAVQRWHHDFPAKNQGWDTRSEFHTEGRPHPGERRDVP